MGKFKTKPGCDPSSASPSKPPHSRLLPANWKDSIRINDQWRICFRWEGTDAHAVEIVDYP